MKSSILLFTAAALCIAAAGAVNAQFGLEYETSQPNWHIHGGAAWMFGDTPDDAELIVGLAYELPLEEGESRNWIGFSADYVPVSTAGRVVSPPGLPEVREGAGTVSLVPALVYWKSVSVLGGYRVWGMLGAGVTWAEDDISEMNMDDGTNFAWMVGAGVDFSPGFFGQVRYIAGDDPGDDGFLTTELGFRF